MSSFEDVVEIEEGLFASGRQREDAAAAMRQVLGLKSVLRLLKKEREDEEDAAWREQGAVVESLVISEESPSEETLRTAIERLDALQKPLLVENEAEGKGKAALLCVMHMAMHWGLDPAQTELKLHQLGLDAAGSPLMQQFAQMREKQP